MDEFLCLWRDRIGEIDTDIDIDISIDTDTDEYMIPEAEKSCGLLSASCLPRKASGSHPRLSLKA